MDIYIFFHLAWCIPGWVRIMAAADCAASVAPLTATPTSARFSAGASFTPSPVMPTWQKDIKSHASTPTRQQSWHNSERIEHRYKSLMYINKNSWEKKYKDEFEFVPWIITLFCANAHSICVCYFHFMYTETRNPTQNSMYIYIYLVAKLTKALHNQILMLRKHLRKRIGGQHHVAILGGQVSRLLLLLRVRWGGNKETKQERKTNGEK